MISHRTIAFLILTLFLSILTSCGQQNSEKFTLIAVGDVMMGRGVNPESSLNYVSDYLKNADAVFINFEGAISNNYSMPRNPNEFPPVLLINPTVAKILQGNNVKFASLANNHGLDGGTESIELTRKLLKENGIATIGDPQKNSLEFVAQHKIGQKNLVFIGINMIRNEINRDQVTRLIKDSVSPTNIIFVSVHWGIEYNKYPDAVQKEFGRLFIDSGADVVIGHHPHVVQPVEIYKNKTIFYSLGNFVFDQIPTETKKGLAIKFFIPESGNEPITYEESRVDIVNKAPRIRE